MSGCCCPDRGGANDFITDEVCGNFTIECAQSDVVWESVLNNTTLSPVSGGTVTVFFDRGCGDLTVNVYSGGTGGTLVTTFDVPDGPQSSTGNTRSQTVLAEFDTVEIVCGGTTDTGSFCTGKYCITAHYRLR